MASNRKRQWALGIVLVVTLYLSITASPEGSTTLVEARERPSSHHASSVPASHMAMSQQALSLTRPKSDAVGQPLLVVRNWAPPPPPPPPAPKPQPPRLPFKYAGKMKMEGNVTQYYVAGPTQIYAIKQGDILEGNYRVLAVDNDKLTLLYLPLQQEQSLTFENR